MTKTVLQLLLIFVVVSCKKSDATLVGEWESYKTEMYDINGNKIQTDDGWVDVVTTNERTRYVFRQDGTVTVGESSGVFEVSGDNISVTVNGINYSGTHVINGRDMTITYAGLLGIESLRYRIHLTSK